MMLSKMELNVARPAQTMKTYARTVTNLDLGQLGTVI